MVQEGVGALRPFMVWNLFLAFVPFGLALVLFPGRRATHPLWWVGFASWVVFLPNAPYVVSDVVHLVDDMQATHRDLHAYAVLACYGCFVGIGLLSYVASLWLFEQWLVTTRAARLRVPTTLALQLVCAVAIYVGRFVRLNSWDVVFAPSEVARSTAHLAHVSPAAIIAFTFFALVGATFVIRATLEKVIAVTRRYVRTP
jgi:uncharacterized membrane protein